MMRSYFLILCLFNISSSLLKAQVADSRIEVAVYYFPNYHVDPFNEKTHGKNWTEWELVKTAKPRFKNHYQPKQPAWGYFDESDTSWVYKEINLAADHGIDVFIYDWYWYKSIEGKKFLHGALENGFLKAANNNRMKFALMWANHDWMNIEPVGYTNFQEMLADGKLNIQEFDSLSTYVIKEYFSKPNYWKIDNKPYFSIFLTNNFINGLGGLDSAVLAINRFDEKVKRAGFNGLHLNLIDQGVTDDLLKQSVSVEINREKVLRSLSPSSVTSYNFLHVYDLSKAPFPVASYSDATEVNKEYWPKIMQQIKPVNYFPNVTMGWDVTPRLIQTDKFDGYRGYPWTPVFNRDNTPDAFEKALIKAKEFIEVNKVQPRILVINAWNEWTEGSYLLPDKKYGNAYLKRILKVLK